MKKGIRKIFSEVPETYELVNHVLTFGLDRVWRRRAARLAARMGGTRWLDLCTGTGEMAVLLDRAAKDRTRVYAADFSLPMLRKAAAKPEARKVRFVLSEADHLPFPRNTFDLVTVSFATRNLHLDRGRLILTFEEVRRVLKPGGWFVNLETSQPSLSIVRKAFHVHVALWVRPVGSLLSGSRDGYAYLSHTIPRFYRAEELAGIMREAGFVEVSFRPLLFAAAAVHKGRKAAGP